MNKEHSFVGLMATIQVELADLKAKYSATKEATSPLTSLKFVIYQGVPTIEIQFDVMNNIVGATYWAIDLSATETGWSLSGYVYTKRDEMVYSEEMVLIGDLIENRVPITETIRLLDRELAKYL